MSLSKGLILKILSAADMQRWNDKLRPMELTELDKQAHKMIIAYVLCKFQETADDFDWADVIEGGFFEFLQRLELTDLKPQILYKIKSRPSEYARLNEWVYDRLSPVISPLGKQFRTRYREYFDTSEQTRAKRILGAAHFYATKWEFDIIKRANPTDYEIQDIERDILARSGEYSDVPGMRELMEEDPLGTNLRKFVDFCGLLRFQYRWGNIRRVTLTSVLGHMLVVALLSYCCSLQTKACSRRQANNYLTGLFHDLPEVLTRDIVSPVKGAIEGMADIIKEYESEQMTERIYSILPGDWHDEMRMFTEDEFSNVVMLNGVRKNVDPKDLGKRYNSDEFNPRDGKLVLACDHLAAFTEAYLALRNGATGQAFQKATHDLKSMYGNSTVAGVNFGRIYADFD